MTRQEWLNTLKKGDGVIIQYLTGEVKDAIVHTTTDYTVSVILNGNIRSYPYSKKYLGFISAIFPIDSFLMPKDKNQKITSTPEEQLRFNLKILLSSETIPTKIINAMILDLKKLNFWKKPSDFSKKEAEKGNLKEGI